MSTKKESMDWAGLFKQAIKNNEKKPVGNGWKTAEEITSEMNVSRTTFKRRMVKWLEQGAVEKFNGTQAAADGAIYNMTWYRIKKGKK